MTHHSPSPVLCLTLSVSLFISHVCLVGGSDSRKPGKQWAAVKTNHPAQFLTPSPPFLHFPVALHPFQGQQRGRKDAPPWINKKQPQNVYLHYKDPSDVKSRCCFYSIFFSAVLLYLFIEVYLLLCFFSGCLVLLRPLLVKLNFNIINHKSVFECWHLCITGL